MSRRPVSEEVKKERRDAVKATLKSLIFPTILCLIIFVGIYVVVNYVTPEEQEELIVPNAYEGDTDPIVMENEYLKFSMDPTTTQFEVLVKSSGKVWKSNPEGGANDTLALTDEKNKLQSTMVMSYAIENGTEVVYDNYAFSAENGIYEIETGDDYVQVNYSIGKFEKQFTIPPVTTETKFKEYCDKMSDKGKELAQSYYKKYDINKLGKKDNKEELLEAYPIMATDVIYVLRDTTKEPTKKQLQDFFEEAGYTYEMFLEDKELSGGSTDQDIPIFNIQMRYQLDGDDMIVSIPMDGIEYKKGYNVYTITMLPYFGAGTTQDEGFILVPEGGGGIIKFNNGKTAQSTYVSNIYGWDMCIFRDAVVHNTLAYYPLFGISCGNDSFICMMEDGASYGAVQADISGKQNSYNYANTKYTCAQREKYDVGEIANSDIYEYIPELPKEDLVQRYSFIDSGSYVDMAKDYSEYLLNESGTKLTLNDDTSAPVVVDIVGAISKVKQILGVPVSRPLELTSFDEASEMVKELNDDGFKNMSVKMLGWCNGGVYQKILSKIKILPQLGGKKGLARFAETVAGLGVDLYLNGMTHYEQDSDIFDGFFSYTDAAKNISAKRARLVIYSSVTYAAREGAADYYLLHTDLALELAEKLAKKAAEYKAGVAFEDTGYELSSDFYKKNLNTREAVRKKQKEQLKEMDAAGQKIMIDMGNDYAMVYSDMITNMDLAGSDYTILDYSVPFYQLAMHGYVNYTGEPLNICGDMQEELLNCAKFGAGLHFTLMKESAFTLQDTLYTQYYGCDYDVWHDRVVDTYTRYNKEMGHIFNQEMTGYEQLSNEVSCTEYADGTKVYVNFGYADYTTEDGLELAARDYKVITK